MPLKSGLAAQFGVADETIYGAPVTPSRFYPFASESLGATIARMESKAILAGRRTLDSTQWASGDITVGGSFKTDLFDHTMGFWLRQAFGGYGVTGAGPYTQTYTPGDLTGKSFTAQVGRPDVGTGTVRPFTYTGCKVNTWRLGAEAGQIAQFEAAIVGMQEQRVRTVTDAVTAAASTTLTSATAAFTIDDVGSLVASSGIVAGTTIASVTNATTAVLSAAASGTGTNLTIGVPLATASYGVLNPVTYVSGSLTVAGSSVPVKSFEVTGDNKLDAGRRFIGSRFISEPLEADRREYAVNFVPEFVDYTLYNRFVSGAMGALVITLASGTSTYTITTNVRFDGDTPNVDGMKIVELPLKAVCIGSTDAAAITVVTVNPDAAY